ncbi:cation:proton antiporter [Eggerthella sinensis]|uniref:cation:proton antiporter n=2 Tax=Eggerthella sinensis TaxID=242230 RepID=UPI001D09829E|nr:sodium:proton antiporter [Eggerthella sinensis]MCB7038614.1 sodium:proton antiporter [Eggerthella sinensis]
MEFLELTLLMLAAVLLSSVIDQLVPKVSSPLIQIALGLGIALLMGTQITIDFDPNLFLVLLIAPLLYDESKNLDKKALWQNRRPVLSLAVGLVIASALIVGFAVNWLIPSVSLAAAFALGAALGPTDAVSVASLAKQVKIPARSRNILESESIINDASGIVSFQFAIAAAVTGTFSLVGATANFFFAFLGGMFIGIALGYLGNFIVRRVRSWGLENTTFHVLFEVFVPFIVYLVANALGTSGIIAVVAAGILNVVSPRTLDPAISRMNIVSTSVWRVLTFALNGTVFVLLGTQLPRAMQRTWANVTFDNGVLIGYILIITLLMLATRFIWVLSMDRLHRQRKGRITVDELRSCAVMTLAGPKGTITLAVAFTIPFSIPQRELLLFLACGVIVVTMLLATFVVPLIAPKKDDVAESEFDLRKANIDILRSVIEELAAHQTVENRAATRTVIRSYNERIARLKNKNEVADDESSTALRLRATGWEKDYVLDLLEREEIDPLVGYRHVKRLSRTENLLQHHADRLSLQIAYLRLRTLVHAGWHRIAKMLPGDDLAERTQAERELRLRSNEHVIEKLQAELASPTSDEPAETISALILEYQRLVHTTRAANPSITAMTNVADKAVDIQRQGLRLELEALQARYEEGRLPRAAYKRLRENVALMQIDLEDNL